ncbi:MAG: hypothetical protein MHMPM18_002648 [Marteilia pararefringens]
MLNLRIQFAIYFQFLKSSIIFFFSTLQFLMKNSKDNFNRIEQNEINETLPGITLDQKIQNIESWILLLVQENQYLRNEIRNLKKRDEDSRFVLQKVWNHVRKTFCLD